ncbi:MFS transporter [Anaerosporobacter sp.]|uniref:MFS transporter n=1 Tax=Anaerosporobacter sp. TaxID=1872529 RepID=UPI0028A0E676|nr:MFS transporter [Anaerosporobacter sp.]
MNMLHSKKRIKRDSSNNKKSRNKLRSNKTRNNAISNMRNFTLFWLSGSVSQLGSAMTSYALIIWAYQQTKSAMTVSLMSFSMYLPYICISIFAGAFIDRHSKKKIMLITDFMAAICTFVIFLLIVTNQLQIWHIYIVNMVIGFANSFQSPAQSVAVGIMVPKEEYARASGMNSFSNNLLTVATPMLAASLISVVGLKGILLIDVVTFLFAEGVLLFFIKIPEVINKHANKNQSIFAGCKEGFQFLCNHKGILFIVLSMACMNFFSRLTYENILSPMILARSGGNTQVLGIVTGMIGFGGILGGLLVSLRKKSDNKIAEIFLTAAFSFLCGDLLMGVGRNVVLWRIAALAASVPIPFITAAQNVIMYEVIPREVQGRIFAVKNAIQFCTIPIGILLGGFLADYVFEPFMVSGSQGAKWVQGLVGNTEGSGMALMFVITGILGCLTSLLWYRSKEICKLK